MDSVSETVSLIQARDQSLPCQVLYLLPRLLTGTTRLRMVETLASSLAVGSLWARMTTRTNKVISPDLAIRPAEVATKLYLRAEESGTASEIRLVDFKTQSRLICMIIYLYREFYGWTFIQPLAPTTLHTLPGVRTVSPGRPGE